MISPVPHGEFSDKADWYVVHTKSRQESRALDNLCSQGFRCFLPTLRVERLRNRQRVMVSEALFPRYLFVHLEAGRSNWSAIRSTRGVARLVEFGGVAARVSPMLIDALAGQPERQESLFDVGDQMTVINGPFAGIGAELLRLYETPDGEARVMVLMDILARPQQISLPASFVRKAA